jgi:hypothetical protein
MIINYYNLYKDFAVYKIEDKKIIIYTFYKE